MIKTLITYSNTAKTAEIMSKYRPIAPKPEVPASSGAENSSMSQKIKQSPYLRRLWPQFQATPTRARKRGRAAISPPSIKRQRTHMLDLSSPSHATSSASRLLGFAPGIPQLSLPNLIAVNNSLENQLATPSNLVTLPLLPRNSSLPVVAQKAAPDHCCMDPGKEKLLDLNTIAEIPEEKDLSQQTQEYPPINVIAPQPVRPVGSSIIVGCINEDPSLNPPVKVSKKPEEVEEEVESETFPAVISDSNNKVRLANSAYKEMVGQPECSWLDSMVSSDGKLGIGACKRICGEVTLHLSDPRVPVSSKGFSCWVRIEWGSEGRKNSTNAFCDVMRLYCESKDYLFTWRFHTRTREGN
ncbi:hypothetical protein K2173_028440 [Erythroxylum novogranatense]|uniref:DUF7950 domain-containing protein n=1 Tax=Erythroxylum novogranatense TaxID=1862640 RepID=A0AAV8U247_9ROSI|nr:hypothetical protein K2173_028440 [Erythroxylum novogranatense]